MSNPATFSALRRLLFAVVLFTFSMLAQAAGKGLLWQAESPSGKASYIFGTMHTDDSRVTDFSPTLLRALEASEVFFTEILPVRDPGLLLMKGKSLEHLLTPAELDRVRELADYHALHFDVVRHMKPWLLAVMLDLPKPGTPFAMDTLLMHEAESRDRPIRGLGDAAVHFGAMDSFTMEEQLTMLRAVLKRSQQEKENDFEQLMNAYLDQDIDRIAMVDARISGQMLPRELWEKIRLELLDKRNAQMAERIIREADSKSIFVAVGAAHLAGESGLIASLRRAGFRLQPVPSPL